MSLDRGGRVRVGESVVGVETRAAVVLTYDDGPTPGITDRLLATLDEHHATATFFALLTRVRRDPGLLREVLASGHEVGLHGLDHRRLTTTPRHALRGWVRDGRRELEDVTARPVRWFRAPYGAQSRASWRAAVAEGMVPVHWSVVCRDWLTLPLDDHLAEVRGRPLAGEVVLLHDGFADATDGSYDGRRPELDRPALTRSVLREAASQGLVGSSLGAAASGAALRTGTRLSPEAGLRARVRRALGSMGGRPR